MNCQECGRENPSDARFCAYCGTPLALECPSCHARNRPDVVLCVACGARLAPSDATSETPLSFTPEQAKRLARYMPRHLITKILENRAAVIGERKQATFLFADVVGSTALGERFDEETFRTIMDGALRRMIEEVHRYEGTIGQLRGDEVFALFGVPLVHEDDPERAVRAALGIRDAIHEYAASLSESRGIDAFDVRVTLNTGDVIVGEIGSDLHAEYTAMGDAVNTAAKLQAVAQPGTIVATRETYSLVEPVIHGRSLGEESLKGKREKVELYEIVGVREARRRPCGRTALTAVSYTHLRAHET